MRVSVLIDSPSVHNAIHAIAGRGQRGYLAFEGLQDSIADQLNVDPNDVELRYYVSEMSNPSSGMTKFLEKLQEDGLAKVVTTKSLSIPMRCGSCGSNTSYERPDVIPGIIDDILRGALQDRYDIVVVVSGRWDYEWSLLAVRKLGKKAYPAFWDVNDLYGEPMRTGAFENEQHLLLDRQLISVPTGYQGRRNHDAW